uniref:Uncharacterized protein n=1 Tax=viral metagenome TaxID=1070528 RepID=A0A6M3LTF1_9ZZZZ
MEKRSFNERDSERVKVVKEFVPKTIQIVLLRNKIVNTYGSVTGNRYSFSGAGSILGVDERDVPGLLAKGAGGTSCCSGVPTSPYFELVK